MAAAECEHQREIEFPGIPLNGGGRCYDNGVAFYAVSPGGYWYDDIFFPYTDTSDGPNLGDGGGCNGGTGGAASCPGLMGSTIVADPINAATGNKTIEETDNATESALTFRRFYNSAATVAAGSMGTHWRHSFDRKVQRFVAPGMPTFVATVTIYRPDGKFEVFSKNSDGVWTTGAENPDSLADIFANGAFAGYSLRVAALRITETYSADGLLQAITDDAGRQTTLTYSTAATDASIAPQAGLLVRVAAANGRAISFTYDAASRVSGVTLPDATKFSYGYDNDSNLTIVTYPGGATKQYLYNEPDWTSGQNQPAALTGVIDEKGQRLETTNYDNQGRATSSTGPDGVGGVGIYYYYAGSSAITDAFGVTTWHQFVRTQGRVLSAGVTTPCGSCDDIYQARTYDDNGYPSSYTDFNGVVTATTYDANGLLTKNVEAQGRPEQRTTATTWDTALRIPLTRTVSDASGTVVAREGWAYDALGLATATCIMDPGTASSYICSDAGTGHAGVRRTVNTYCTLIDTTTCPLTGLLLKVDGPRTDVADTLAYAYYLTTDESGCNMTGGACHHLGDLRSVTDGAGLVTTYVSYDRAGRPSRVLSPNGVMTDYTYTSRGWLATKTVRADAAGTPSSADAVTTLTYEPTGLVQSLTDADGVKTNYGYDAAHRLTDITDASGNHIHYTVDVAGNRTSETVLSPSGAVVRSLARTFNTLGRLTAVKDGLNRTVFNAGFGDSYDGNGNLVHTADGLGIQQKNILDGLNRLTSTIRNYQGADAQTANAQAVTSFDALDRISGFSDPDGLNTTYGIDAFGNVTTTESPDTGTTQRGFDISGNQISQTDAVGVSRTSTFDADGRLSKTTYADPSANSQFAYDEADAVTGCTGSYGRGYLTRAIDANGSVAWCYDGRGNVVEKRQTVGSDTRTTHYAWTLANRLKSVTTPNGTLVSYTRNSLGQITAVQVTPNGGTATTVVSNVTYQPFGSVSSYKLGDGQTATLSYDATGALTDIASPAFSLHVKRDVMGNITSRGETADFSGPSETYGYDALYRLTDVAGSDGTSIEAYTYNKTGDRLTKAAPGLLTGSYAYGDGTHHLTGVGSTVRQVDARGNTTADVLASGTYGFGYSQRNRLTVVQKDGLTVGSYVLNAFGQRVQKTAGTTSTRFDYAEDSRLLSEKSGTATRDYVWMDDLPVGVVDGVSGSAAVNFVHADGLGTPRAVTDSAGSVLWRWDYAGNPFGEELPTSAAGYALNLRFPGQYFDAESGLNYNVNRDYEPAAGRYIQSDPIGLLGGFSTFGYAFANPHNFIDPLGLSGILVINSSGAGDGILGSGGVSGHSWVSYTPDGGQTATYGTWGNNPQGLPNGLEHNLELGRIGDATRAAQLTDDEEAAFYGVVKKYEGDGENAWGYLHPCSSFAADAWNSSTGESLSPNGPYSNPSSLKQSIIDANGGVNHGSIGPNPPSPWPQ